MQPQAPQRGGLDRERDELLQDVVGDHRSDCASLRVRYTPAG
jgi:hypothetical protein